MNIRLIWHIDQPLRRWAKRRQAKRLLEEYRRRYLYAYTEHSRGPSLPSWAVFLAMILAAVLGTFGGLLIIWYLMSTMDVTHLVTK